MRRATIFVLSDVRSGSTLLDQCLGGHPNIVSLGELHWLTAYLAQDRSDYNPTHPLVCSCGVPVRECQFWSSVERALGHPLSSLHLRSQIKRRINRRRPAGALIDLPFALIRAHPVLYRYATIRRLLGSTDLARDCVRLYDAVSKATGLEFCVDSSKSPYRFRDVYGVDPARTRAIALARDYRAVVHSKMKRGQSLKSAALGWRRKMQLIRTLTADLPASHVLVLKYESLCRNPGGELGRVAEFLNIEFAESMLRRATANMHHIGGSPSKFDLSRIGISFDRCFESRFSQDSLNEMRDLVGDVATEWGY